jgi:RND superfamily putative drug exporter
MPNTTAVAYGLERTGRIVSAAALLMCVALGSLMISKIEYIKELGLGAAFAVAIDALLLRPFLVPALMKLLGRWNWWPSGARSGPTGRDEDVPAVAASYQRT